MDTCAYNPMELMICCAARCLEDGKSVAVGPGAREAAGLSPGGGPYRVITDLAILGYHQETKRMEVLSLHPGVTLEQVRDNTGFELGAQANLLPTSPPTVPELKILREEVDPFRYIIGRE